MRDRREKDLRAAHAELRRAATHAEEVERLAAEVQRARAEALERLQEAHVAVWAALAAAAPERPMGSRVG